MWFFDVSSKRGAEERMKSEYAEKQANETLYSAKKAMKSSVSAHKVALFSDEKLQSIKIFLCRTSRINKQLTLFFKIKFFLYRIIFSHTILQARLPLLRLSFQHKFTPKRRTYRRTYSRN
jgi:hypothetical protein